jgi:hypothetical protein
LDRIIEEQIDVSVRQRVLDPHQSQRIKRAGRKNQSKDEDATDLACGSKEEEGE